MRETEFWRRLEQHLGATYARTWASHVVLAGLDGRSAQEALDAGVPTAQVWRAVWAQLELPDAER